MKGVGIEWNVVSASGPYSSLAGTLAALVFAGMIFLLSKPAGRDGVREPASHLFYGLLVAFASLVISSYLFAVLTGQDPGAQAFLLGIGASSALVLSVLQLLLVLIWCFEEYDVGQPLSGAYALFAGVLVITGVALLTSVGDYLWARDGQDWKYAHPELVLLGGSLLVGFPLLVGFVGRWMSRRVHPTSNMVLEYKVAIALSGGVVIVIAAVFGVLADLQPADLARFYPYWVNYVVLAVIGACETLYVLSMPARPARAGGTTSLVRTGAGVSPVSAAETRASDGYEPPLPRDGDVRTRERGPAPQSPRRRRAGGRRQSR